MANSAKLSSVPHPLKAVGGPVLTLDDLSDMSSAELGALYAQGAVPLNFAVLGRRARGRVLAVRYLDGPLTAPIVRAITKLPVFPWLGKSMAPTGSQTGDGINRIKLGMRANLFPFTTRVAKSAVDGRDTIYVDYRQKGNPWLIQMIRDELREIEPGLFLGPAMWKTGRGSAFHVLWFALDAR